MAITDLEEIPVQSQSGVITLYQPHRDGNAFRNRGIDVVFARNDRGAGNGDVIIKFIAKNKCSQGELHDIEHTIPAATPNNQVFVPPLSIQRFNQQGLLEIQWTESDGSTLLPDDDAAGHPDSVGLYVLRLYDLS